MYSDAIHICYSLYDKTGRYSKILGTSMLSLLENTTEPLTIHLICYGEIADCALNKFRDLVERYGQRIIIYNSVSTNEKVLSLVHRAWLDYFSPAAIGRLFIWEILPISVQRIIWLDADTIVNMDIAKLWQERVGKNGFAAVVDKIVVNLYGKETILSREKTFDTKRYINAGVVLMEREYFCLPDWMGMVVKFLERYPNAWYAEQDILNYYFGKECRLLSECYNTLVGWQQVQHINNIDECIYHYSGNSYNFNFSDVYTNLFFHYFVKTPWYDLAFLRRLCSVIPAVHDGRTKMLRNHYRVLAGKEKIAVGAAEHEGEIRQIMQMTDKEPYIVFVPGQKQQNIDIQALAAKRGMNVFLLFDGSYADLGDELKQYGCQDNVDFVNGNEYLTLEEGCPPHDEHAIFMQL